MKKLRGSVIGFGNVGQQMTRYINRRDDVDDWRFDVRDS